MWHFALRSVCSNAAYSFHLLQDYFVEPGLSLDYIGISDEANLEFLLHQKSRICIGCCSEFSWKIAGRIDVEAGSSELRPKHFGEKAFPWKQCFVSAMSWEEIKTIDWQVG